MQPRTTRGPSAVAHRSWTRRLAGSRGLGPWLAAFVLLSGPVALGNSEGDDLKAMYLLNVTRYVDWPESAFTSTSDSFEVCVLDDAAFAATAAGIFRGHTVAGRRISVTRRDDVASAAGCHVLFVSAAGRPDQGAIIEALAADSVLTLSETDGFAAMGGIANFVRERGRLGLAINRQAARRAGLRISARLLRIAEIVG